MSGVLISDVLKMQLFAFSFSHFILSTVIIVSTFLLYHKRNER